MSRRFLRFLARSARTEVASTSPQRLRKPLTDPCDHVKAACAPLACSVRLPVRLGLSCYSYSVRAPIAYTDRVHHPHRWRVYEHVTWHEWPSDQPSDNERSMTVRARMPGGGGGSIGWGGRAIACYFLPPIARVWVLKIMVWVRGGGSADLDLSGRSVWLDSPPFVSNVL